MRTRDLATRLKAKAKGRRQDLEKAVTNHELHQPGLMEAVAGCLADGDPSFADYVASQVLPAYGRAAVPHIVRSFNPSGNMADARRLHALRLIDLEEARRQARGSFAANVKHKELAKEAFKALSGSEADGALLLQQARKRMRNVRERRDAYSSLQGITSDIVVEGVCEDFNNRVFPAFWAMANTPHPRYKDVAMAALKELQSGTIQSQNPEETADHLYAALRALRGYDGPELDDLLHDCVGPAAERSHLWNEMVHLGTVDALLEAIAVSDVPRAQRRAISERKHFPGSDTIYVMAAASRYDDVDLFELFSEFLEDDCGRCRGWGCGSRGNEWACSIFSAVEFLRDVDFEAPGYNGNKPTPRQHRLVERIRKDPRWFAAVGAGEAE